MAFKINERCTACAACAGQCPTGAIRGDRSVGYSIDPARCIDCGACGVACPDEAVSDPHGEVFGLYAPDRGPGVVIDLTRCSGCGWCVEACRADALTSVTLVASDGSAVRFPALDPRRCTGCEGCVLACGAGAVSLVRRDSPGYARAQSARRGALAALGLLSPGT